MTTKVKLAMTTKLIYPAMPEILEKHLRKAIETLVMLENYGIQFYVSLPNGQKFGKMVAVEELKKKRSYTRKYAQGELRAIYWPYLEHLQVGDVACIPITEANADAIASAATACCSTTWGRKAHESHINKTTMRLEILRKEPEEV